MGSLATVNELEAEIRVIRYRIGDELASIRANCAHERVYRTDSMASIGYLWMCADCLIEAEGYDPNVFAKGKFVMDLSSRDFFAHRADEARPLYARCYGDKHHPTHICPVHDLTKGSGTRCRNYTGFFDHDK
jgi:hypothetical protein